MFNNNKYFDCIYCINLPHRTDRLAQFKKNNAATLDINQITVFSAINGKEISDTNWKYSAGALGCRLSHLAIYKDALLKNHSRILILEDDVSIKKGFKSNLQSLIDFTKEDWDLIYLGGTHFIKPDLINKNFIKLNGTLALHAVAINCRCLKKLIDAVEMDKRWIDSVIAGIQPQLKVYGFAKPFAIQTKGYSDIQETYVDYNISFTDKLFFKIKSIFRLR